MRDMTESHVVEKRTPVHHQWWFWAVVIAFMALSLYSGSCSSTVNVQVTVEDAAQAIETPQRWSDLTQADASPMENNRGHEASIRFAAILKLNPGLIVRLNQEKRLLYVDDAIWKVTSSGRRAFTIRAIVDYLDWIHGTSTGMVDVRSFRNRQRLMITGVR